MVESQVAVGSIVEGRFVGDSVRIEGEFRGELALRGDVVVAETGRVRANVTARRVTVSGAFEGEIRAERAQFTHSARARGRFVAPVVEVAEGAQVEGAFNLEGAAPGDAESGSPGSEDGADDPPKPPPESFVSAPA